MGAFKRAYVAAARESMRIPFVTRFFDRAAEDDAGFRRWLASLLAIYQLDRMIRLDIPWWNVAATEQVEAFLRARPGARVFEYGSGASSAWLAKRCGELVSVEHDRTWCDKVGRELAGRDHCRVIHQPIGNSGSQAYVSAIDDAGGEFDLIVIDGRERAACLEASVGRLAADGIVLFDDSGRRRYRPAINRCALEETRHYGRSYCVPYPDHSSVLRRPADTG